MASVNLKDLGKKIKGSVIARLQSARLDRVLVSQAQSRIRNRGDSQHRYPELWKHPKSFRSGGQPLRDTGTTMSSLSSKMTVLSDTKIRLTLTSPHKYALAHQLGFETKGPNFIPLTKKARRNATRFKPMIQEVRELHRIWRDSFKSKSDTFESRRAKRFALRAAEERFAEIFVLGETYIMAWQGVKVPQRKIFNMPPENVEELRNEIRAALN